MKRPILYIKYEEETVGVLLVVPPEVIVVAALPYIKYVEEMVVVLVAGSPTTVVVAAVLYMEGLAKTVVVLVDVIPYTVMAGCSKIAVLLFVTIQWKHSFSVDLDEKANSRQIKRAQIWTWKNHCGRI